MKKSSFSFSFSSFDLLPSLHSQFSNLNPFGLWAFSKFSFPFPFFTWNSFHFLATMISSSKIKSVDFYRLVSPSHHAFLCFSPFQIRAFHAFWISFVLSINANAANCMFACESSVAMPVLPSIWSQFFFYRLLQIIITVSVIWTVVPIYEAFVACDCVSWSVIHFALMLLCI